MSANPHANGGLLLRDLRLPDFRTGSITATYGTCGKPSCHCHRPNQSPHGPNFRLTRKVKWKTITETFATPAALQKALGLSREDAEAVKLGGRPSNQAQADVLTVLCRVTEEVVAEIQRSFEFYLASAGDEPIERLYLSGGSSRIKGLSQVLASRLKLSVELLNPFRRIDIPEKFFAVDYVHDMGPMAAVAAGLALRRKGDR